MGGCASKNKQPKEEAYKPANAPTEQPAFEEIIPEEKVAGVASKPPMKQNGSVTEGEKRKNEFRNSLVGPGGVILPNQPMVKDETDPSIPFIDASEDELEDEETPSRSVKAVQPTVEAAIEPIAVVGVEAMAPGVPAVPEVPEVPEVPLVPDVQEVPLVPLVPDVQEVPLLPETTEEAKAAIDVSGSGEAAQIKFPTQEAGNVEEDMAAAAATINSTDLVNDTEESFVDEVLRGVAPQLMATKESYQEPPIEVEAVAGSVGQDEREAVSSAFTSGQQKVNEMVEDRVENGVAAAEDMAEDVKEVSKPVIEDVQDINLDARTGGIIQMGENSLVEFQPGFDFKEGEQCGELKETSSGLSVSARGPGGPGIVQIGTTNKVVYGSSNDETEETKEFTGFRTAGADDTDCVASPEQIAKTCESVGFIFSSFGLGVGFRVGDRYIMTAYHLIRDMFDEMAAQGIMSPETHILGNKDIWIQFDYLQMGEYEFDNLTRFKFASFCYSNPQLDVVIIELEPHEMKTMPPPLVNFCGLGKRHKVEFVGHDAAPNKRQAPSSLVLQPSEMEMQKAAELCKKLGFPPRGYDGLKDTSKLRFQCAFEPATSGSPGIVVNDDEVYVVVLLTKGYPSFYLDVDEDQQDAIPSGFKLVEGASMTDVYLAMKDQTNLSELCDSVFGLAVSKQS